MRKVLVALVLITATPADDIVAFGQFWELLISMWSDAGCRMDPNGNTICAPAPQTDSGCIMDPNGACKPGS